MVFAENFLTTLLLPFLLIFVVVFAILEKASILGKEKHQINAIVALVIGLAVILFPGPREIIVTILPWLAVGVAVLLVFFILYGFFAGDLSDGGIPGWLKVVLGILVGLFVIGIVSTVVGFNDVVVGWFQNLGGEVFLNIFMVLLVIGGVIWAVASSAKGGDKGKGKDK